MFPRGQGSFIGERLDTAQVLRRQAPDVVAEEGSTSPLSTSTGTATDSTIIDWVVHSRSSPLVPRWAGIEIRFLILSHHGALCMEQAAGNVESRSRQDPGAWNARIVSRRPVVPLRGRVDRGVYSIQYVGDAPAPPARPRPGQRGDAPGSPHAVIELS